MIYECYGKDVGDDCDIIEMFFYMCFVVDCGYLYSVNDEESDMEFDEEFEEIDIMLY